MPSRTPDAGTSEPDARGDAAAATYDAPHGDAFGETEDAALAGDAPDVSLRARRAGGRPVDPVSRRGQRIGRYVVIERLGAGAMGVVLAAYDPELDRKVALKLLHPHARSGRDDGGQLRLLAEAQALARLSDPHVVAVHDVGTHEGSVFVAMEFVEGQTLGRWLAERRRAWSDALTVMLHAGRGLAAAHARDLVHRDFKPDNVMLDHDGRVRVMDFGLARAGEDSISSSSSAELETSQPRQRALDLQLTDHGTMVGTPAYMAPECINGERGGPAADQFSFCVTLWEALYGQPPFDQGSLPELFANVVEGDITPPPTGSGVPRWLRPVVQRGLAVAPEKRWPSMVALLEVLERGRARARYRRGGMALALAGSLGAAAWGAHRYDQRRQVQACEREGASIEQVWNDEVAAALGEALESTPVPHARDVMDKTRPWLDEHARAWQAASTDACLGAEVEQTLGAAEHAWVQWCLDDRRMELEALLAELGRGGMQRVNAAVVAAARLEPVSACTSPDAQDRMSAPPPEHHAEVRVVKAELWRASALDAMGAHEEALGVARDALARAETVGWPPLTASARLRLGIALEENAKFEDAARELERTYFDASRAGALTVAYGSANQLVGLLGYELDHHDEALRWARHAQLVLDRLGGDGHALARASLLVDISTTHYATGDYAQAQRVGEEVLELFEAHLGPRHPRVGDALTNLGVFHQAQGDHAVAKALYERARAIKEQSLGPLHPEVAELYTNLGGIEIQLDQLDRGQRLLEHALEILEGVHRGPHPSIARLVNNLAVVHMERNDHEHARPLFERALEIYEQTLGPDNPSVADAHSNLAEALGQLGNFDDATDHFQQSIRANEAALGPDHPDLAYPLVGLGGLLVHQERYDDAVPLLERALRLREQAGVSYALVAETRFTLARALRARGHDPSETAAMARRAAEQYRQHPELHAEEIAEIEAWLSPHDPPTAPAEP